jgi:hypothetical protein
MPIQHRSERSDREWRSLSPEELGTKVFGSNMHDVSFTKSFRAPNNIVKLAGQAGQIATCLSLNSSLFTWPTYPELGLITCPETQSITGRISRRPLLAISRACTCNPAAAGI